MKCPVCDSEEVRVRDSRHYDYGIRRRRVCKCGHRWSTVEVPAGLWARLMREEAQRVVSKGYKLKEASRMLGVVR